MKFKREHIFGMDFDYQKYREKESLKVRVNAVLLALTLLVNCI